MVAMMVLYHYRLSFSSPTLAVLVHTRLQIHFLKKSFGDTLRSQQMTENLSCSVAGEKWRIS